MRREEEKLRLRKARPDSGGYASIRRMEKLRDSNWRSRRTWDPCPHRSRGRGRCIENSRVFRLESRHIFAAVLAIMALFVAAMVKAENRGVRAISGTVWNDSGDAFVPSNATRLPPFRDRYHIAGVDVQERDSLVGSTQVFCATSHNRDQAWIPPAIEGRPPFVEFLVQTGLNLAARISFDRLFLPLADGLALGCRDCHREVYDQWAAGAHALGARNTRFLTMYNGTDVAGNQSPRTRYGYRGNCRVTEDYGLIGQFVGGGPLSRRVAEYGDGYGFPLRPDPNRPYYGPGYRLDFPQTDGNCATCHLPGAAIVKPYGVDPNEAVGVDAQGSHCDLCHEISAVRLDSVTGLPCENMPGILSIEFARPGPQVFLGSNDDVDIDPNTGRPLIKKSEICAPCHQASFWGVPVFETFGEWLASPYPAEGKTCQSCHMKPSSVMADFTPEKGGLERDPEIVSSHYFPGAVNQGLLEDATRMDVNANRDDRQLTVTVTITNNMAGHRVPTGSPLRHLILLVEVSGSDGKPLAQLDGPTVPDWCGMGDPAQGCYAGLPGKAFAKVLQEWWTEIAPTGAYWSKIRLLSDNRIAPAAADTSLFIFDTADHEEVIVNVRLLYRRAFLSLMKQKGWEAPDIVTAQQLLIEGESLVVHTSKGEVSR